MHSVEVEIEQSVVLVLERDFAAELGVAAARAHVWLVDTPENRSSAVAARNSGAFAAFRITTFSLHTEPPSGDEVADLIDTICEHHPACAHLQLVATVAVDAFFEALNQFGFVRVAVSQEAQGRFLFVRAMG